MQLTIFNNQTMQQLRQLEVNKRIFCEIEYSDFLKFCKVDKSLLKKYDIEAKDSLLWL